MTASLADVRQSAAVPQRGRRGAARSGRRIHRDAHGAGTAGRRPRYHRGRLALAVDHGALVVRPLERMGGETAARPLALLPAPDPPFALHVGSQSFKVRESPDASRRIAVLDPAELEERRGFFPPRPLDLRQSLADGVGDCHAYDDRSLERRRHRCPASPRAASAGRCAWLHATIRPAWRFRSMRRAPVGRCESGFPIAA